MYPNINAHIEAGYELIVKAANNDPGKAHAAVVNHDAGRMSHHFVGINLLDALRGLDSYLQRHGDGSVTKFDR